MADLFLISLSPPNTLQPKSIGSKQVSLTFSPGKWSFPVFFFLMVWVICWSSIPAPGCTFPYEGGVGFKNPRPGLLWLYLKLTILMDLHGVSPCSPLQIHILSPLFDFFVVVYLVYHFYVFVMATQPNNQKLFCYAPEVFGNPPIRSLKESLFVCYFSGVKII